MKAFVFREYGSPDVLELIETEKPEPKENEVLVKILTASVNALDWHRMRGEPFLARLTGGFSRPDDIRIGADFAGRVEAVGKAVTEFSPGDEVFGTTWGEAGAFAEYAVVPAENIAPKPANISFEEAAAVPVVAFTALQGLEDTGHIQAGEKVLVNGASGGVGSMAVMLAKSFGAEVTAVCSSRNLELVRSIGADNVLAYDQSDFTKTGEQYDLIYCAVGNRSISDYKRALKPNGRCVIAGFTNLSLLFQHLLIAPLTSGKQKVGMMETAYTNKEDLLFVAGLLEVGKVKSVIDRCYPFKETPEAIRYLETNRARGKVIISPISL